ncbi:MAG: hypothetical protein ABDH28_00070 [Brevinematia bacterium]
MFYICRNKHIIINPVKKNSEWVCGVCGSGINKIYNNDMKVVYDGRIIKLRYVANLYKDFYKQPIEKEVRR